MAFTFTNYRPSTPEQQSPYGNLLQNAIKNYQASLGAQYARPNLQEALMKMQLGNQNQQLQNQYYGPNIESQIGLRGAQTREAGARTGLLGEQTTGARIENQLLPEKLRAAIQLQQAVANKRQAEMQALNYAFGGGFGNQSNQNIKQPPLQENGQGYGVLSPEALQQQLSQGHPQTQVQNNNPSELNPMQSSALSSILHYDVNPAQSARIKALGSSDAKKIAQLEDTVLNSSNKLDTLNSVSELITNPEFENIRQNPILGKHELGWFSKFGTPEQQELVGNFKAYTGDIIKGSSRDFAGQFRKGEQFLLESMKPTDSDSLDVMKGKTEALQFMVQAMAQRAKLQADAMRNLGLSPLAAKDYADKQFSPAKLKEEINNKLHPEKKWAHLSDEDLRKISGE